MHGQNHIKFRNSVCSISSTLRVIISPRYVSIFYIEPRNVLHRPSERSADSDLNGCKHYPN